MTRKRNLSQRSYLNGNTSNMSTTISAFHVNEVKREIEQKCRDGIQSCESVKNKCICDINLAFNSFKFSLPKHILDLPFDMNDEFLMDVFLKKNTICNDESVNTVINSPVVARKRRTRSVVQNRSKENGGRKWQTNRSSSLDMFQTPANKMYLANPTTEKKYTVSKVKKDEDTGITFKRIMKQDEEAISTRGSPLCVQPTISNIPTMNIPLSGGVIIIEPEFTKFTMPELDDKTKSQVKALCEKLQSMF